MQENQKVKLQETMYFLPQTHLVAREGHFPCPVLVVVEGEVLHFPCALEVVEAGELHDHPFLLYLQEGGVGKPKEVEEVLLVHQSLKEA